jgi:hypothetical protein
MLHMADNSSQKSNEQGLRQKFLNNFDPSLFLLLVSAIVIMVVLIGIAFSFRDSIVGIIVLVAVAGYVGGGINAVMSDNSFVWPSTDETKAIKPGFIRNILVGMVAAVVSWGLYGSFADTCILGCEGQQVKVSLTITALLSAVLIGMVGARWLSAEADKKLLNKAVSLSLASDKQPETGCEMSSASPSDIYAAVNSIYQKNKPS